MKALVLKAPGTPFVLEQVPDPTPGPDDAVARVLACGSGLTIQHTRAGRARVQYPRIIGHEIAAEVVAVGANVKSLAVGDGVTAYFYLTCGECRWCLGQREPLCDRFAGYVGREIDGGYAEYIRLPARSFVRLPESLDYRARPAEAGVVTDALATPLKVLRRARVTHADTVAVFGAGGGLGIHQLMLARFAHARVIAVDTRPDKFAACRAAGADECVDAARGDVVAALLDLTQGKGIDVAIDYVSSAATLEAAFAALGKGGRLVTLGGASQPFRADPRRMLERELDLLGSRYVTRQDVIDALELVARGVLRPLVTEVVRMDEAEALHRRLEQGLVTGRAALRIG